MKTYVGALLLAVMLTACATKEKKKEEEVVEEKAIQSNVKDVTALRGTIQHAFEESSLPAAKKDQLRKILDVNKARSIELSEKAYEYRAVLIEELLSGKMNPKRVKILKADIKKVEDLRLKNTFDTVEQISAIVSDHPDKDKFTDHLINYDRAIK
jgi:PBP1b-binding outer membrane lipoprotein LpoB